MSDRARRTLERLRVHPLSPSHDIVGANALFNAGEITPLDYLVVREELLDGELVEITWRRNLPPADKDFAEREWQAAALEEALRRIKPDVRSEHYAAFVASAVEGQDTETVMHLYNLSRDNLYQIRKRLTAKLQETVSAVLAEMETPACSDIRGNCKTRGGRPATAAVGTGCRSQSQEKIESRKFMKM